MWCVRGSRSDQCIGAVLGGVIRSPCRSDRLHAIMSDSELLDIARDAARAGADHLSAVWSGRRSDGTHAQVTSSSGRDVKTAVDVQAETVICARLESTGLPILSEERGADSGFDPEGTVWIVDPLDGTMNLVRGFEQCCVSIGLWRGGQPVAGVIHDFVHDRVWWGRVGEGTFCDGEVVSCSTIDAPDQAMLTTGFPGGGRFTTPAIASFIERVQAYKKVRMIGSAAMSLAHVASGTMDLYLEEDIYLWDVAAGLALVQAANGAVWWSPPDSRWRSTVVAGAPALVHRETT